MYDTLRHYVLRAWSLGLSGQSVIDYVVHNAGTTAADVEVVVDTLVKEMSE